MEANGVLGTKCGCGSNGTTVDDILPLLKSDEEILEAEDWPRPKSELMEAASSEVQHIAKAQHLRAVQWVLPTMHVITISYRWEGLADITAPSVPHCEQKMETET